MGKISQGEFLGRLRDRNSHYAASEFEVVGEYAGIGTPLPCRCLVCGNVWDGNPDSMLRRNARCPKCGRTAAGKSSGKSRMLTHEAFAERAVACCPDIEITGRYAGANTRLTVRCRRCGYEWDAFPATVLRSCSCPCCTNRVAVTGINDLATTHPQIAAEWNHERNGELEPTDVVAGSSKRVWWRCHEGHEWQAIIYRRKAGSGNCPVCGK